MKKKIVVLVCVLLVSAILFGCGTTPEAPAADKPAADGSAAATEPDGVTADGNIKIGVSMSTLDNPFYSLMASTFESYGKEKGVEVVVTNADGDLQKQQLSIEDLVAQDIDALIINPFEADAFAETVTNLRAQGIYVVTVDNEVSADTPVHAAVLTDNFGNGVAAGEKLVELMGNEPIRAFLISGDPGSYVGKLRRDGLIQGIVEKQLALYGKTQFEIVYQIYIDGWSHDQSVIAIEQSAPALDFNVMLTESDEFLYVSREVLQGLGVYDYWKAASADGSKNVLGSMVDGSMKNLVSALNNPIALSEGAIDAAIKLCNGEAIDRNQLAPVSLFYDKTTAESFYDPNSAW